MKPSLSSLSRATEAPAGRHRFPAWTIPAAIVLGFALLFLMLFRDRLLPAREVEVAGVLATPAADADPAMPTADSPMAFQASGWVEPDPLPIKATALVDGVIDEVHVLEGDLVEQGQRIATLIREDFELALRSADKTLLMREAEVAAHLESIQSAQQAVTAGMANLESARARLVETLDRKLRVEGLASGTISETEITTARAAHRMAQAAENASQAAVKQAEAEARSVIARTAVLESAVAAAMVEVEKARLALARTRISAPTSGRVLRLMAAPGQKKRLAMDDPDSATVAILYDPARLQVRVDVPLADAAGLQTGQQARIRSSLLPERVFHGEVTRITGEADLQRNTLQAKVRIQDPSDQLRPEMLCRVEFLSVSTDGAGAAQAATSLATWIPQSALDGGIVWVCHPETRRVERREVTAGSETRDAFIRIRAGLRPGEWVVLAPQGLDDGRRVKPRLVQP